MSKGQKSHTEHLIYHCQESSYIDISLEGGKMDFVSRATERRSQESHLLLNRSLTFRVLFIYQAYKMYPQSAEHNCSLPNDLQTFSKSGGRAQNPGERSPIKINASVPTTPSKFNSTQELLWKKLQEPSDCGWEIKVPHKSSSVTRKQITSAGKG